MGFINTEVTEPLEPMQKRCQVAVQFTGVAFRRDGLAKPLLAKSNRLESAYSLTHRCSPQSQSTIPPPLTQSNIMTLLGGFGMFSPDPHMSPPSQAPLAAGERRGIGFPSKRRRWDGRAALAA